MSGEVDVYDLLKRNGLPLAPHMVNILKELGYNSIHTLVQIEDPESLQKSVVETLGEFQDYQTLPDDEKKLLLGPRFWRSPSCFKFLPGEQAVLKSIKSICTSLLENQQPLVHVSSSSAPQANGSLNMASTKHTLQQLPTTSSGNSSSQKKNKSLDSEGKERQQLGHVCQACNKSFTLACRLASHKRVHSREKPFECDQCNQTFAKKSNLKQHVSSVHLKEKRFKCEVCSKFFTRKETLVNHSKVHSKNKIPNEVTDNDAVTTNNSPSTSAAVTSDGRGLGNVFIKVEGTDEVSALGENNENFLVV